MKQDISCFINFQALSANLTKWSNTLKQFVSKLPTNRLSVFDHFAGLALKRLKFYGSPSFFPSVLLKRINTAVSNPEYKEIGISLEAEIRSLESNLKYWKIHWKLVVELLFYKKLPDICFDDMPIN